jgi:hypothetical protein
LKNKLHRQVIQKGDTRTFTLISRFVGIS